MRDRGAPAGPLRALAGRIRDRRLRIFLVLLAVVVVGAGLAAWPVLTSTPTSPDVHRQAAAGRSRPTTPAGLKAVTVRSNRIELDWSARAAQPDATYRVYRDGKAIGTSSTTKFADRSVRPATTYTYTVALITAGQPGTQSAAIIVATPKVVAAAPTPASSPAGFPDAASTGYQNAPGYPGFLTDCSNVTIRSDSTYRYCDFPDGLTIGSEGSHPVNVTFIGCRFASNAVVNADVADYGAGIRFLYDTFEPDTMPAGQELTDAVSQAIAYNSGYQYGIDQRYNGSLTVDHANFWGFAEAMQIGYSSQSSPLVVENSWIHNPRDPGTVDHTDGLLENYGGLSYMVFNHNTIVGDGNTNALALQGSRGYDHITITSNYFSGYGYMVNSGANTQSPHMVFTGNVWGTNIEPHFGPLYGNAMYTTPGLGSVWHDNTIYVLPGTTWMAAGNNGLYWWPTDGNPASPGQIVGHTADYPGP